MKTTHTIAYHAWLNIVLAACLTILCLVQPALASRVGSWISGSANLQDSSGFTLPGTHDGYQVSTNGLTSLAWSADIPSGFSGQSLDFAAGNVAVVISNTSVKDGGTYMNTFTGRLTNRFSFTAWYRVPGPQAANGCILSQCGLPGFGGHYLWLLNTGTLRWRVPNNPGGGAMTTVGVFTNEVWYHVTCVMDAADPLLANKTRIIYVNGQVALNQPSTWGVVDLLTNSHVCIGATENNLTSVLSDFWRQKLYDVRVYDMVLTSNEILDVMNPTSTATFEATLVSFGLPGNPASIDQTNKTIAWTVPYGTDVTNLPAVFRTSYEAQCDKLSGSVQDFSSPVPYVVVSQNKQVTNTYVVTVTVTPISTAKDILTFGLPGNPAVITGTNIDWGVPYGSDLTTLAPTYTVSQFATGNPASGSTNDFTTPQSYRVTAQDLSTKDYRVSVFITLPTIVTFGLPGLPAVITGTNIQWNLPFGTDVTSLAPEYTPSGLDVVGNPLSGTSLDFTTPQTYVVTTTNFATNIYTVTATVLPTSTNHFWTNTVGGTWSTHGSWTNADATGFGPFTNGLSFYRLYFYAAGTYTVTNDLTEGFLLNQLNFGGATVTLTGNGLTLTNDAGQMPQINQSASANVIVRDDILLATNVTAGGTGGGQVTLRGLLSGTGSLIKNGSYTLNIYTNNVGSPNTYSGGTVLNSGTLTTVGQDYSWFAVFGTGPITVNGGSFAPQRTGVANVNEITFNGGSWANGNSFGTAWYGPIILNTNLTISPNGTIALYGDISGPGGITGVRNTTVLNGTNTYTGGTTVTNGAVVCNIPEALAPGRLNIFTGAVARLNYTGTRTISRLTLGGVDQPDGEYGAIGSSAPNQSDFFSNAVGTVTVIGTLPFVDITNDSPVLVDIGQASIALAGTNNDYVVGDMWISNAANDSVSIFPATSAWTSATVPLLFSAVGETNLVSVYGTNDIGIVASDSIVVISVPEPIAVGATVMVGYALCVGRKRMRQERSAKRTGAGR